MQLRLEHVVPIPLKDKIVLSGSSVWNQNILAEQGEYIFIKAPSGTGKTTLIHILYGLRKDVTGNIYWQQQNISAADSATLAALRTKDVSIVFQDMRLFAELTALENLEIKRTLTNTVSTAEAVEWMERLGLKDKLHSQASTLSYGEQQRVAIIRALLQPFSWLLMDEPFSHLDDANIKKAVLLIQDVATRNNAGLILADLEANEYFNYSRKLLL